MDLIGLIMQTSDDKLVEQAVIASNNTKTPLVTIGTFFEKLGHPDTKYGVKLCL
jgi:hypothetical protein